MAYTEYFQFTTGLTLYGKARPYNATWATGVVTMVENSSTGEYSSASFVDGTQYGIFIQAGGSPASSDTPVGSITPPTDGLDAAGIRSAVGLASANLDDQLSDVDTALAGIPEPMTAAQVRSAIGMASADLDTQLSAIVGDTNELQSDWTNGGRLDTILDSIEAKTDLIGTIRSLVRW